MATMSLDKEIKKYLPQLGNEEKQSLLSVIKSFIKLHETTSQHISIEEYNRELDEAEAEMDAGEFHTHEEVVEMSKKW